MSNVNANANVNVNVNVWSEPAVLYPNMLTAYSWIKDHRVAMMWNDVEQGFQLGICGATGEGLWNGGNVTSVCFKSIGALDWNEHV